MQRYLGGNDKSPCASQLKRRMSEAGADGNVKMVEREHVRVNISETNPSARRRGGAQPRAVSRQPPVLPHRARVRTPTQGGGGMGGGTLPWWRVDPPFSSSVENPTRRRFLWGEKRHTWFRATAVHKHAHGTVI